MQNLDLGLVKRTTLIFFSCLLNLFLSAQQGETTVTDTTAPRTNFGNETGVYGQMLQQLERRMLKYQEQWQRSLGGKKRTVFVPWIRDHVHVMKAMKFIHPDLTSFFEYYLQHQTKEGLYFDYYYPIGVRGISDRMQLFGPRYWEVIPKDSIQMHRLPVEADLEYLMVEGVYYIWQATGDTGFVKKWLPALVKGMHYSMTDPLRWSTKYNLVKRGYTLDTWDFMQLPLPREEYTRNGGNVQKGIFNIDEHTPMGIMHGDNSGMYAACNQLATLFTAAGDNKASRKWRQEGIGIRERTNRLCWNGKFYAHFIEDDPQPSYLKMDQRNTLSMSNAYDINRGLPTREMAASILKTYDDLKKSNSANSFAEWYGVYPAVQPHFADYKPGSYMNGGVTTIVAGELAKAAFQNGFEAYGVDILQRLIALMEKHNGDLTVSYTPEGKVDEGIPDNWGQAAVYSALMEGLAGIVDKGTQFHEVELSPRWLAAAKDSATVTSAYAPTGAFVRYTYLHHPKTKTIQLKVEGNVENGTARILLPDKSTSARAWVNEKVVPVIIDSLNESRYAVLKDWSGTTTAIKVSYQ